MGEGTDLAQTSPFSEEQAQELRCSTHPAALCRGEPAGKLGPKEAPPWVRGTVLPRNGTLLHGLLGNAGNLLLENTSLRETTEVTIIHTGQRHTEAELLSGCLTLFMLYTGFSVLFWAVTG